MIFVCCAIKLLRSTFQLPSLALSLNTPLRAMESVYNHTESPGFRLSEEPGVIPCAGLLFTQRLEGCCHPQTGWKWWFSSQYSPTFSHCKPISIISGAESCDDCLHTLHFFKWDPCPPVANFCPILSGSFLTIPLLYSLFPNLLCFHILLHMCHTRALPCFRALWGSWSGTGPAASAERSGGVTDTQPGIFVSFLP